MSKAVQHDLLSLLPTISLPLPPELINLAVSLLAQSRSKAANLKPDEEIARGYACAHITCERLKQALDLPAIVPRPPLPPRAYKKFYAYLDSALAPRPVRQPETTTPAPATPSKARNSSAKATPSKTTPQRTPKPPSAKRPHSALSKDEVPNWVMPAIRTLCKSFQTPSAAPHIYVGVSSIVQHLQAQTSSTAILAQKRARRSSSDTPTITKVPSFEEKQIPALIAVVALFTFASLSPTAPSADEYRAQKELAVTTLLRVAPKEPPTRDEMSEDVELFLREAQNGWLDMEWYRNLKERERADELDADNGDGADEGGREEDDEVLVRLKARKDRKAVSGFDNGHVPRRGGMMTAATDWLSEERRADYRLWKAKIIREIERIEKEQGKAGT